MKPVKPYHYGRLDTAFHDVTGEISVDDTVVLRGYPQKIGKVLRILKSNRGRGRPEAEIAWNDNSRVSTEPLGRLRKVSNGNQG